MVENPNTAELGSNRIENPEPDPTRDFAASRIAADIERWARERQSLMDQLARLQHEEADVVNHLATVNHIVLQLHTALGVLSEYSIVTRLTAEGEMQVRVVNYDAALATLVAPHHDEGTPV